MNPVPPKPRPRRISFSSDFFIAEVAKPSKSSWTDLKALVPALFLKGGGSQCSCMHWMRRGFEWQREWRNSFLSANPWILWLLMQMDWDSAIMKRLWLRVTRLWARRSDWIALPQARSLQLKVLEDLFSVCKVESSCIDWGSVWSLWIWWHGRREIQCLWRSSEGLRRRALGRRKSWKLDPLPSRTSNHRKPFSWQEEAFKILDVWLF